MMENFDADDWEKMSQLMKDGGCSLHGWNNYFQINSVLTSIVLVLVAILLVLLIRHFYQKGGK